MRFNSLGHFRSETDSRVLDSGAQQIKQGGMSGPTMKTLNDGVPSIEVV
jgi:hypothetical protein